ncbi:AraC family transcriptional regulator [Raoultella sp. BIGb0149]|uniref:AraC family transcriptional regulator n=1 Tax=unclassified Raoultella TaxID=2627600 RepID=UPI00105D1702|nr:MULTISPECIES: helix-turn-helix transcriptional regulator [Raoultella]TDQ21339.1 AraC family transcriptional regulator [Raoultella sp. BIGb0149]
MITQHAIEGLRQLKYTPGSEEPVHQHEQGQLIYALRGVAKIVTPQHIWLLSPGRAVWLPGGMPHGLQAVDHVVTQNLYLTPPASRRFGDRCRGLSATPLLHALIAAGLEEGLAAERQALVYALLSDELARLSACALCHVTLPSDRRVRQVCDTLCRELDHAATLAWWGQKVGASERTLARLFREETQLSFSEWRQQIRLLEAVCNLARGVAVSTLANELGYASASAFIAMFRKKLGVSPQRYIQATGVKG